MKKLSKINLELNKEVISSLSGNEKNSVKGGTIVFPPYSYNINNCDPQPITIKDITCVADVCQIQTGDCYTQQDPSCIKYCLPSTDTPVGNGSVCTSTCTLYINAC